MKTERTNVQQPITLDSAPPIRALAGTATGNGRLAPEPAAGIGPHEGPAVLLGCAPRRSEGAALAMGRGERRGCRWCIVLRGAGAGGASRAAYRWHGSSARRSGVTAAERYNR
jgi:hypothetical protein